MEASFESKGIITRSKVRTVAEVQNNENTKDDLKQLKIKQIFQCNSNGCQLSFKSIKLLVEHVREHFKTKPVDFEIYEELINQPDNRPYKCQHENCHKSYARSEDLNTHSRVHRGLKIFECHKCQRIFAQAKNLANHVKNVHHEIVDPERLMALKENNDKLICEMDQLTDVRYERVQVNDKIYVRKFGCPLCFLIFVKMKTLEIHCRRNHLATEYTDAQLADIEKKGNDLDEQLENERNRSYTSIVCIFKCAECAQTYQRPNDLVDHVKSHFSERHKCKYCSLTFLQQHSLISHLKKHEGDNLKKCGICQIPFVEEKDLAKHCRIHLAGKPHVCDFCGKGFAQSCDKNKHMRIHTGERPFECKICHKKFTHLTSIKKHNLVHSGAKHFVCNFCGKAFNFKSNLVVHNRTHTGERPYICKEPGCNKTFYASGHFNDHMKIHAGVKNYKCKICDKEFLHQSSFRKHEKMHSGVDKIKCNLCDKSFTQQGHFKEHLRIHTGEKPFSCSICQKAFRRTDALNSHMKNHANTKLKDSLSSAAGNQSLIQHESHTISTFYPIEIQISHPTTTLSPSFASCLADPAQTFVSTQLQYNTYSGQQ